jgi:hypothetical protein
MFLAIVHREGGMPVWKNNEYFRSAEIKVSSSYHAVMDTEVSNFYIPLQWSCHYEPGWAPVIILNALKTVTIFSID